MKSNAEREFLDSIRGMASPRQARAVQARLDAAVGTRLPVGDAREIDPADLMPAERRALFGAAFEDTQPMGAA